jgi:hypothetical protein
VKCEWTKTKIFPTGSYKRKVNLKVYRSQYEGIRNLVRLKPLMVASYIINAIQAVSVVTPLNLSSAIFVMNSKIEIFILV